MRVTWVCDHAKFTTAIGAWGRGEMLAADRLTALCVSPTVLVQILLSLCWLLVKVHSSTQCHTCRTAHTYTCGTERVEITDGLTETQEAVIVALVVKDTAGSHCFWAQPGKWSAKPVNAMWGCSSLSRPTEVGLLQSKSLFTTNSVFVFPWAVFPLLRCCSSGVVTQRATTHLILRTRTVRSSHELRLNFEWYFCTEQGLWILCPNLWLESH